MLQRERSLMPRRGFLSGLVALPLIGAAGLPVAASSAAPADLDVLWLAWLGAKGRERAAIRAWRAAEEALPWWVRSGPAWLHSDGTLRGPDNGFPAIQGMGPSPHQGAMRRIRPTPYDIQGDCDQTISTWGESASKKAIEHRDRRLAELRERQIAAQLERERVNEPALSLAADAAADVMFKAEDVFLALEPTTPAVAAAHIMSRAAFECRENETAGDITMEIAALALRGFLPMLSGEIAVDAADFIADPERPISDMRIWRGIEPEVVS